jgi:uncharacterized protein (TIGR02145 family)
MKTNSTFVKIGLIGILFSVLITCKKETPKVKPTITASSVTNITANSATAGGTVSADGGAEVTSRGVCWSSTNTTPTIADSKTTDGSGVGFYTSSITGLLAGTNYNIRAYATNSVGTAYYSQVAFKTLALAPVLITADFSTITATSFISGGNITNDGGSSVTTRGVCWSINQNPTISDSKTSDGSGTGSFTSSVTGLSAGTTYYVRAYATNTIGTSYGNQISTKTSAVVPTLITTASSSITSTTAASGGNITSDGGAAITARGVCWSTTTGPTTTGSKTSDNTGTGNFTSSISGLTANTTYYVRAYATNSAGTGYGTEITFKTSTNPSTGIIFNPTLTYGTVSDNDNNVYKTKQIGTQVWMAENLKATKYNDGTAIPLVTDNTDWTNLSTPGFCWYNNADTNKDTYGALYNWYTVNTGKLCPTGWHMPSDAEWTTLTTWLGGESISGGKLKETGTSHWLSPNTGATNTSGFTAIPGGYRGGAFGDIDSYGTWWSSTEYSTIYPWERDMFCSSNDVGRFYDVKQTGRSVRCLKN